MSEQQRIFLAISLCLGIFLVWQHFLPQPPPPPVEKSAPAKAAEFVAPSPAETIRQVEAQANVPMDAQVAEVRKSFSTPYLSGEVSNKKSALTKLDLLAYRERTEKTEAPRAVTLATTKDKDGQVGQAFFEMQGGSQPFMWQWQPGDNLALDGNAGELQGQLLMTPRQDAYAVDYELKITNRDTVERKVGGSVNLLLESTLKHKSGFLAPPADQINGLCSQGGTVSRHLSQKLKKESWKSESGQPVDWVAIDRQYFVVALVAQNFAELVTSCEMRVEGEATRVLLHWETKAPVASGTTVVNKWTLFSGPKRDDQMIKVAPGLADVIDYNIWYLPLGSVARPMVYLLNVFHGMTASWGLAILLLTLVVKLLLFPVTFKSIQSMQRMQKLRPEMDKIQKQFANDKERQQLEQMKLFREKGVNPLGGCLPMLLQMPIWLALYRVLWSAVDLYQQPFLWLADLTAREPFPILALALGALMFVQQKMTPTTVDNQQAKMMLYTMPVMMTVFMVAVPSGLVLYSLYNSILTIVQQLVINRFTGARAPKT